MNASLPPNSNITWVIFLAHLAIVSAPAKVEPVRLTNATLGFSAKFWTASPPAPLIKLIAPPGIPASINNSTYLVKVKGLWALGFKITLFPINKAAGTFWQNKSLGKLNGITATTTPKGAWTVYCKVASLPFSWP